MNDKRKVVNTLLKSNNLKLTGAYALAMNANNEDIVRLTKDIDINIFLNGRTKEEALDEIKELLNSDNFKLENIKKTKSGNLKGIINDLNGNLMTKIDIEFKDGALNGSNVDEYIETLKNKLTLKFHLQDRRFKDVIDIMNAISLRWPNGVKKSEIISIIPKEEWVPIDFELQMEQANKFIPQIINNKTVQEYVIEFISFVSGIIDDGIDEDSKFINGQWYEKF